MSKQFDGRTPPLPIRALYALRAAVVNPSLFWELGKKFSDRNLTAEAHARRVNEYDKFSVSAEVAVAAVTLANHGEVVDALSERALETIRSELRDIASEKKIGDATWGGFGEVCYAICRLMKPLTVLETGVAFGVDDRTHTGSSREQPARSPVQYRSTGFSARKRQDNRSLRTRPPEASVDPAARFSEGSVARHAA